MRIVLLMLVLVSANAVAQLIWGVYNIVEVPGRVVGVDGGVLDYIIYDGDTTRLGILPVKEVVRLTFEGGATRLFRVTNETRVYVVPCAVNYTTVRLSSSLSLSVAIYLNGTRAAYRDIGPGETIIEVRPNSSGLYNLTLAIHGDNGTRTVYNYAGIVRVHMAPHPATYGDIVRLWSDTAIGIGNVSGRELELDTLTLGAGNHTVTLTTNICDAALGLQVRKSRGRLVIAGPSTVKFGRPVHINASLILEGGRSVRKSLMVLVNGTEEESSDSTFTFTPWSVGKYNITVLFPGDADVYPARASHFVTVVPLPINMTNISYDLDVEYGRLLNISVYFDMDTEGTLFITLSNKTYTLTVRGDHVETSIDTMDHVAGHHTLIMELRPSSSNFAGTTFIGTLNILRTRPRLHIAVKGTPIYGKQLEVLVSLTTSNGRPMANRTVIIDTGLTRVELLTGPNGTARHVFTPQSAGLNVIWAMFPGDGTSLPAEGKTIVRVGKATPILIVNVNGNRTYGNTVNVDILVRPRIGGIALLVVNETYTSSVEVRNGIATIRWTPPRAGLFNVTVKFASRNPNYRDVSQSIPVNIEKANCYVRLTAPKSVRVFSTVVIHVDYNVGQPSLYVNGSEVPIDGGRASLRAVRPGAYNITAFWPGDDRYNPCSDTLLLRVERAPAKVYVRADAKRVATGVPLTVKVEVLSPSGVPVKGPVSLSLIHEKWGTIYSGYALPTNGTAMFRVLMNSSGAYTLSVRFLGDEFHTPALNDTVKVFVDPGVFGIPAVVLISVVLGLLLGTLSAALSGAHVLARSNRGPISGANGLRHAASWRGLHSTTEGPPH